MDVTAIQPPGKFSMVSNSWQRSAPPSSTMFSAGRSLTDPPGFSHSALA